MSQIPSHFAKLAQKALALAPTERARLADLLLDSLEAEPSASGDVVQAWADEIERRLEELEARGYPTAPASPLSVPT